MRAATRWCLPILLLAAMLCAHTLAPFGTAVAASAIAADDAATPSGTPGNTGGLDAPPPPQIPHRSIGPAAAIVVSITMDALLPSGFPDGRRVSVTTSAPALSLLAVHPTPHAHAIPLLI